MMLAADLRNPAHHTITPGDSRPASHCWRRPITASNLTEYDLSGAQPVRFELQRKAAQINMRVPKPLLDAVKARAKARGIPYTRFIREALEQAVVRK